MIDQILAVMSMVVGAVYVLVLPGVALSFAFLRRREVDVIERVALSFALSIAVVPLVVFYLNLMGVRVSRLNVLLEVLAVIVVALFIAWRRGSFRVADQPLQHQSAEPPTAPPTPSPLPSSRPLRRKRSIMRL